MLDQHLLSIILFAPFVGAAVLLFVDGTKLTLVRSVAAVSSGVSFAASIYLLYAFNYAVGSPQFQFLEQYEWSKDLGISFFLGVDGMAVPLVLASSLLLFAGVFVSWHIEDRAREFYIFLLILASATIGVYVSLDLFFLYFFYEMSVVPMYPLLGIWGSHTKGYLEMKDTVKRESVGFIFNFGSNSKEYAAMKLTLFLSAGAGVALLGIFLTYVGTGLNTFNLIELQGHEDKFSPVMRSAIWLMLFFGFASIAPLWPMHSWSPVGHAAAPAAVSMLHAGVLMKLGHFSIIRVGYWLFPQTTAEWAWLIAVLCVFSIIYGGLVAFFQRDTKYVIGYSSSSHMGYIFLGMAALNMISMTGAVLYMFAHALATGMLFAMAGWVYDQTHTRDIPSLGGLGKKMPFIMGAFVVGLMASVGLPGTVNFIGELMVFAGSWDQYPVQVVIAVVGITITLGYLLRMFIGLFLGDMDPKWEHARDAKWVDRVPILIMISFAIFFGLFPAQFIHVISAGMQPILEQIHSATIASASAGSGG
jgi:NADH-quinone oxidoreductase subunit M